MDGFTMRYLLTKNYHLVFWEEHAAVVHVSRYMYIVLSKNDVLFFSRCSKEDEEKYQPQELRQGRK